jgi:hypothetical protein
VTIGRVQNDCRGGREPHQPKLTLAELRQPHSSHRKRCTAILLSARPRCLGRRRPAWARHARGTLVGIETETRGAEGLNASRERLHAAAGSEPARGSSGRAWARRHPRTVCAPQRGDCHCRDPPSEPTFLGRLPARFSLAAASGSSSSSAMPDAAPASPPRPPGRGRFRRHGDGGLWPGCRNVGPPHPGPAQ